MIKAYTDIEQSKKLAEILPPESADMCRSNDGTAIKIDANPYSVRKIMWKDYEVIPCWSLAALLGVLPTTIGNFFEKNAIRLRMDKGENDFNLWYENFDYDNFDCGDVAEGLDVIEDNPIDACYEMIVKLHEQKLL